MRTWSRSSVLALISLLLMVFAVSAWSEENARPEGSLSESTIRSLQEMQFVSVGSNFYYFDYHEHIPAPAKSTEKGVLPGLQLMYHAPIPSQPLFIRGRLDFAAGNTTYDGTLQDGKNTPHKTTTENIIFEGEGNLGFKVLCEAYSCLSLYTGIGFHFWKRDIQGSAGIWEDYSWPYIPLGVNYYLGLHPNVSVSPDVAMIVPFAGSMTAHTSEWHPLIDNTTVTLGTVVGFRAQLPLTVLLSRSGQIVSLTFSPWFEYTGIGESDWEWIRSIYGSYVKFERKDGTTEIRRIMEPSSSTYRVGINLAARISW